MVHSLGLFSARFATPRHAELEKGMKRNTMKKELGDWTSRFFLCFSFSSSAGGLSKSMSFCSTCPDFQERMRNIIRSKSNQQNRSESAYRISERTILETLAPWAFLVCYGRRETEGAKASKWRRRRGVGLERRGGYFIYKRGQVGWRIWAVHRRAAFISAFRGSWDWAVPRR